MMRNINFILNKKGGKLFLISVLIILFGLLILFILKKREPAMSSAELSPELFNHPIYSQYKFSRNDSVINIGIQPFYLPTGIILEVVKRDKILQNALNLLGKEIIYYPFFKGADINYFLQQKKIDAGVSGDMPVLTVSSDLDILIPVILQKGNVSIVSNQPMLTNNMKGKRIGYPFGSIAHYFLLDLLQDAGIGENEVSLIPFDVTLMSNALHTTQIDLFTAWEPIVASALKQYPEFVMTFRRISTGYLYFSKEFAIKNPETVNFILAAVIRAVIWLKMDRNNLLSACNFNIKEMERLSGERSILNAKEIAALALQDILKYNSKYSIVLSKDDTQINSLLHAEYKFLKKLNTVPASNEWDKVSKSFNHNLILSIYKQPTKYNLYKFDYDIAFDKN